jgi:DNA repair protein RadC
VELYQYVVDRRIHDVHEEQLPREWLVKFGLAALSDVMLLAILLCITH